MSGIALHNILFLDIETAPQYSSYQELPLPWKELWDHKSSFLIRGKEEETSETIYPRAAIYAEFGKIICISCGVVQGNGAEKKFMIKSFAGDDEKIILQAFCSMITKWAAEGSRYICAHNGKEFDFPYLCRRLIIQRLPIPGILFVAGKKPWETCHIDTMDMWKFGDYKNFTSLNLLAHTLGIETPKDDIDGSQVWKVYWQEKDLARIVAYCQKDVLTVAQVYLAMNNEGLIPKENIEFKS